MDSFSNQNKSRKDKSFIGKSFIFIKDLIDNFLARSKKNSEIESKESTNNYFDKKLVLSLSKSKIPNFRQLKYLGKYLNSQEKLMLKASISVLLISALFLGSRFYVTHLEEVPIRGGEYVEGLIGVPKHINPLYSLVSDVDHDIATLVFSSLYKKDKEGKLISDIAESYELSDNKKEYTFQLRKNAKWHDDNDALTASDVVFTFDAIKNKVYQSPLRAQFAGVEIEQVDDYRVKFKLVEPYVAFPELLTFGIMPEKLWGRVPAESALIADYNIRPKGSGPYKFKSLIKDKITGKIISFNLVANEDYYAKIPYITNVIFRFYPNHEEALAALNDDTIDGIGYLPPALKERVVSQNSLEIHELTLPHVNSIFFNDKKNAALGDKVVRKALLSAINKNDLVNNVFSGNARVINGPILPESSAFKNDLEYVSYNINESKKMLEDAGWIETEVKIEDLAIKQDAEDSEKKDDSTKNSQEEAINEQLMLLGAGKWRAKIDEDDKKNKRYLIIELTIPDKEESIVVADMVKSSWERIGVKTIIKTEPSNQIQPNIIQPRNFQALLFGQIIGYDPDVYAFWHSTQIGEDGLNLANFSNNAVDKLLEEARVEYSEEARIKKYNEFQQILNDNTPVIFLYSPLYLYPQSKNIKNFEAGMVVSPSDRFVNISNWYTNTGKKIVFK